MSRRWTAAAMGLALLACKGGGGTKDASPIQLETFQPAAVVLGQPDFTSASPDRGGAVQAGGVHYPVGDATLAGRALVLPDSWNHRLLEYRDVPATNGAPADIVHGQPDGTTAEASHAAGRFHRPHSVAWDGGRLVVADALASRVQLGTGDGAVVVGWGEGAPTYRSGCAADRLGEPWRAIVAGKQLVVVDRANHRVLIWNAVPEDGAPADVVLGQRDFTHCAPNDALGKGTSGGRSASTFDSPTDAWSDGTRLLVVDQGNNRVLLWNRFPTVNGAPADVVLGQPDFRVGTAATTQAGLRGPSAVASDGKSILVADSRNHRVLAWSAFPSASGAPADRVLGQNDFRHGAANDDDQDGVSGAPTARTLHQPMGIAIAGRDVVVTDTYNHRFLLFRSR